MCKKIPLHKRAKIAGVVDMVLSAIGATSACYDILLISKWISTNSEEYTEVQRQSSLVSLYIVLSISLLKFIMGFVLFHGAHQRNSKSCRQWLYVSAVLWCIQLLNFILRLIFGAFVLVSTITTSLIILIRVLVMFNVYRFINEIRRDSMTVPVVMGINI